MGADKGPGILAAAGWIVVGLARKAGLKKTPNAHGQPIETKLISETAPRGHFVSERHVVHLIRRDHPARDDLFCPGVVELHVQLVALDPHDLAIAELLVEHPVP
jgi:hypothetical protein